MDPITIASLTAMLASAYMQKQASDDANRRANDEIRRSLENQRLLQIEAENNAINASKKFAPEERIASQKTIEDQIATDLMVPVEKTQSDFSQKMGVSGNVSNDYSKLKSQSDLNVLKSSQELARIMSKISSGNRLRMNEGIGLADSGRSIDMLNNFSRGQQGADNIAIQKAGQLNTNKVFAGQVLGALGQAGMIHGASKPSTPSDMYSLSSGRSSAGLNPSMSGPGYSGSGVNPYRSGGFGFKP